MKRYWTQLSGKRLLSKAALFAMAIILSGAPSLAFAGAGGEGYGYHMGWGGGGFMWFLGPLVMIGTVILIVYVVVRLIGSAPTEKGRAGGERKTAVDILEERYARGEIDHDEFEQRRQNLGG